MSFPEMQVQNAGDLHRKQQDQRSKHSKLQLYIYSSC